jgi:hypothetical protein
MVLAIAPVLLAPARPQRRPTTRPSSSVALGHMPLRHSQRPQCPARTPSDFTASDSTLFKFMNLNIEFYSRTYSCTRVPVGTWVPLRVNRVCEKCVRVADGDARDRV